MECERSGNGIERTMLQIRSGSTFRDYQINSSTNLSYTQKRQRADMNKQ